MAAGCIPAATRPALGLQAWPGVAISKIRTAGKRAASREAPGDEREPTGSLLYVGVTVDDDHAAAGEHAVDDEADADVRRVLTDRRADLRHDLLGRHAETERGRPDRD